MPALIDEALEHIEGRYKAENAILVNITDVRDTADTAARKQRAAALVEVVRDCLRRHEQLQAALQRAGRRFRAEQDRQTFAPARAGATLDLHAQLLVPALELPVAAADLVLATYFTHVAGPLVRPVVRMIDLFTGLITPPAERDVLGGEVEELDLDSAPEEPPFPEECYEHLEELLDLDPDAPRRLSGLLEEARTLHPQLPELVVVRVLAQAAQEIGGAVRHGAPSVLIAVDDGTALDDPEFAGADLIVARAAVVPAAEDPAATTDPPYDGPSYDGPSYDDTEAGAA
jgi:hypothetical protein